MTEKKYYNLKEIDEKNAQYNLIFGERSNGKTTAVLERILYNWINKGEEGAYVRRYDDEIRGSLGAQVWTSITDERGLVEEWTGGEYTNIEYYNRKFYLSKYDEKKDRMIKQREPFCHAFAINTSEKLKGTSYPNVQTICFDEFLTRQFELNDEFIMFSNLLSTIIRNRDGVKIYMLGNTVNQYSTYFDEMGLYRAMEMEQGDIDTYVVGENGELKICVEYCGTNAEGKKSDEYFAFDSPKLKMITEGKWEIPTYPHAPCSIDYKDVIELFFIEFRDRVIQGDIVLIDNSLFIYLHDKTTPIRDREERLIYSLKNSPAANRSVSIINGRRNKLCTRVAYMFREGLVYYQNNSIGELVRNYIQASEHMLDYR